MLLRLIALNARFVHSAPALFYLRRLLARRLPDARLELCQLTINDPYYETLLQIIAPAPSGEPPRALFFSVYVWNAVYVRRLLLDLWQLRPDLPVVLGGPEAPQLGLPAKLSAELPVTLVRGAAEGLADDFYADLAAGRLRPLYQAAGRAEFAMPYRPEDFSGELKNRHLYYESSRGCPFACSYCLSSAQPGVVYRDQAATLVELGQLLAWRPAVIRFVDRTFNAPPARALAIWRFLAEETARHGYETVFHFEIAPDLFDEASLAFLVTVPPGLFRFEIGLQSFTPASLAAVNRQPDLAGAEANIRRLVAQDNIHLHLDLILGLPFETRASYLASLNRLLALRPHHLQLGLLKVLPDTPLAARREEFGLRHSQTPPYPVLASRWLPQDELAELYRLGELIEDFYNPRYFAATLGYLLAQEPDPARFFSALQATLNRSALAGRARTQELLSRVLAEHARKRSDAGLLAELLCFDWLACGHRRLPPHLTPHLASQAAATDTGGDRLREARDRLWHRLPEDYPPFFTPNRRSAFFKRATFAPFSAAALKHLGLADGSRDGVVAFLPEQDDSLKARQRTALFC